MCVEMRIYMITGTIKKNWKMLITVLAAVIGVLAVYPHFYAHFGLYNACIKCAVTLTPIIILGCHKMQQPRIQFTYYLMLYFFSNSSTGIGLEK